MRTIWKFPLVWADIQSIAIPEEYVLLSVQIQRDVPTLWAIVDEKKPNKNVEIICHGTGHAVDKKIDKGRFDYLGTVQHDNLVFHFFGELR